MKVLDSRVLIKLKKGDELIEKFNGFSVPVGLGEYDTAEVVSVGPDLKDKGIEPGNTVYVYQGCGKKVNYKGEDYVVVTSSEIIVILD
jgi:co-chaperonin GroES (HSP10)